MTGPMDANQYVFVHGMRRTRTVLERWGENPWPVLGTWFTGAFLISLGLLAAVIVVGSILTPDYGFHYTPTIPQGADMDRMLAVLFRNSLVLALHAFACIAGFIAGATLPLSAARRTGISRVIHEKARPIAFGWVIAVTCFSLCTQAGALGLIGSTIASRRGEWDQLLAATMVTVAIAIPMLIVAAAWEVHIWPYILRAAAT